MFGLVRELHRYSSSGNPSRWLYAARWSKGCLFGYNPNRPFPAMKGNERRGLVGQTIHDWVTMAVGALRYGRKAVVWAVMIIGAAYIVDPGRTVEVISPVVSPIVKRAALHSLRLSHLAQLADAIQIREGLYLSLPPGFGEDLTVRIVEAVRVDDEKVRSYFGSTHVEPILIRITPTAKDGGEPGTVILGHYILDSPKLFGMHAIEVSVPGALMYSTVAHELTHVYVRVLNPTINTCIDEGLAHFVQGQIDTPSFISEDKVDDCPFPSAKHWSSESSRSQSDSQTARAIGYVVVHHLHVGKGLPLEAIALISEEELPSREEIDHHLRHLKLSVAKQRALRRKPEDIDLKFWKEAYLRGVSSGSLSVARAAETVEATSETFQNLMDLTVQHLRWAGMSESTIEAMPPESLMKVSGEAVLCLDKHLDALGVLIGEEILKHKLEGVYDGALERLVSDNYEDSPAGRLVRAIDQGWARVYASKRLPNTGALPPYTPALLDSIRAVTGDPSPAREALWNLEHCSRKADAAEGN